MNVRVINRDEAIMFLKPKHYSGRNPQITIAFGWFFDDKLKAVCTFGKPASSTLCAGSFGASNSKHVYELNRLCRTDDLNHQLSQFVSKCLKLVKEKDWIVFSYSDTGMNHNGYIYQACNFIYTGATKKRLEFFSKGKHSRHGDKNSGYRQVRTSKHRYLFLCTSKKWLKRKWLKELNYPIIDYPKGKNENYKLGTILKPIVVKYDKNRLKD